MMTNSLENRMTQILVAITALIMMLGARASSADTRPNILVCISDDQSYAHTGANGDPVVQTPAFDRIAHEGLRFTHAFCDAPTCGPSRSAILTGQHICARCWLAQLVDVWPSLEPPRPVWSRLKGR